MQSFAEQLNAVRKQRNITQEQLAERMNVSRTTISRWESGKIMPDLDTIRLLSSCSTIISFPMKIHPPRSRPKRPRPNRKNCPHQSPKSIEFGC